MNASWKFYGIDMTVPEYERLLAEQGNICALCEKPPIKGSRLVPDHDHETGVIRGLIHSRCNLLLGNANDSSELLDFAARYLRKSLNGLSAKVAGVN
jgi:hypothetical protein